MAWLDLRCFSHRFWIHQQVLPQDLHSSCTLSNTCSEPSVHLMQLIWTVKPPAAGQPNSGYTSGPMLP